MGAELSAPLCEVWHHIPKRTRGPSTVPGPEASDGEPTGKLTTMALDETEKDRIRSEGKTGLVPLHNLRRSGLCKGNGEGREGKEVV